MFTCSTQLFIFVKVLKCICDRSWFQDEDEEENQGVLAPKLVASLTGLNERFVQISPTNAYDWHNRRTGVSHTVALSESGKVYAFGGGGSGQLGLKLAEGKEAMPPLQVDIDLA
jgi:alpha-tubulin suppressor-like RCC1 family protein